MLIRNGANTFEEIPEVKKQGITYINIPFAFDIESSSFYQNGEKRAVMYAWVGGEGFELTRGRSWSDFVNWITLLKRKYNTNIYHRIIIYIHNLSYEFQFFRKYFQWETVFALDTRKPIYAVTKDGIEFRCSYILTNYKLENVAKNLSYHKLKKRVGDLDYSKIRHCKTPLTDEEWGYIEDDVNIVVAHIYEEMHRLGDITKLPLTNTGYVRRLCRNRCLYDTYWYRSFIHKLNMTMDDYVQFKRAFMGGFTHANVNHVGKVYHNVSSYDFTSSYPAVMCSEKFPMSTPRKVRISDKKTFNYYIKNYCCIFDVKFEGLESCQNIDHYISLSRCIKSEGITVDNGRLIKASEVILTITEVDFAIISKMYTWDKMQIANFKIMAKDYLPKPFIETIIELYEKKTILKGVEGSEAEYLHAKEMLNSLYGMCVMDPCRDEDSYIYEWIKKKCDVESAVEKYNKDPTRFLYYAWGVYVTAYARKNLFTAILTIKDDYIYSDTDSVKILNHDKYQNYFEKYNQVVTRKINECLTRHNIDPKRASPLTIKGKVKPLGVWDYEETYDIFKTLGAKRYLAYSNGEIYLTVAGVAKKAGSEFLKSQYKTVDKIFINFKEGLLFPSYYENESGERCNGSGKMTHTYIDDDIYGAVTDYLGNEYEYNEMSSVHLENTSYKLTLASEFEALLKSIGGYK